MLKLINRRQETGNCSMRVVKYQMYNIEYSNILTVNLVTILDEILVHLSRP